VVTVEYRLIQIRPKWKAHYPETLQSQDLKTLGQIRAVIESSGNISSRGSLHSETQKDRTVDSSLY
jgi:hypothetical protein